MLQHLGCSLLKFLAHFLRFAACPSSALLRSVGQLRVVVIAMEELSAKIASGVVAASVGSVRLTSSSTTSDGCNMVSSDANDKLTLGDSPPMLLHVRSTMKKKKKKKKKGSQRLRNITVLGTDVG